MSTNRPVLYWLPAIRDKLRETLDSEIFINPVQNIRLRTNEKPIATAGNLFVSIFLNRIVIPRQLSAHQEMEISLGICLTQRIRSVPHDREDSIYLGENSLLDLSGSISAIVRSAAMITKLDTLIPTGWSTSELLNETNVSGPTERFKAWYNSDDPNDDDRTPAGYSVTMTFEGGLMEGPQCS